MKALTTSTAATAIFTAGIFAFAMPRPAFSETASRHDASALLDEAKKSEYERKIAAKQTEMDRLNEDLKKGEKELETLDKGIQKVGTAESEATKQLEQFTAQKKRATAELELLSLRIEAERIKGDGLRMLQSANRKALDAMAKRNEETTAKTALVAAETRQLGTKSSPPDVASGPAKQTAKNEPTLTDWRKKLAKAERASGTADHQAREAMTAASTRLQEAEKAAAKAEKKQAEIGQDKNPGFPGGNDPLSRAGKR